jgi:6,7-dimethyl-8-ribityllumazine synthase
MSRQMIYDALVEHAKGHIKKHSANVEIYMEKAVGVGEHPDILDAIEKELAVIAQYHDQLEVLEKYIKR